MGSDALDLTKGTDFHAQEDYLLARGDGRGGTGKWPFRDNAASSAALTENLS